jgi:hypothetical protein
MAVTVMEPRPRAMRPVLVSGLLKPWHGCMDHNRNHCPECRTCDCHETTVLAHKAADYQTGDPEEELVELHEAVCAVCGAEIAPLLGKVREGTMVDYTVWIPGNYEHVKRPKTPHAPVPKEA